MVYDPAWDMPRINWQPQGSYEVGIVPLVVEPDEGPLVCLPAVNQHWLPLILGCIDQLRNPSTWIAADDTAMYNVLMKVDRLMQMIGDRAECVVCPQMRLQDCVLQFSCDGGATWTDVIGWSAGFAPCVSAVTIAPVPGNPGDLPASQRACNIAGFIAKEVVQVVIQKAVSNFHSDLTLLTFGLAIFDTVAFAFPLTAVAADILYAFYLEINTGNISDFDAASTDPVLVSTLTCAIYNAIRDTGYITAENYPDVVVNVCGMSYTYTDVVEALCTFFGGIGLLNLEGMQNVGALDDVDCSSCGTWCYEWDGPTSLGDTSMWSFVDAGTPAGQWVPGTGFESFTFAGGATEILFMTFNWGFEVLVSDVFVTYTCPAAHGVGDRHALTDTEGHDLDGGAGTFTSHLLFNVDSQSMTIELDSGASAGGLGHNVISNLRITGRGANPFGVTNC